MVVLCRLTRDSATLVGMQVVPVLGKLMIKLQLGGTLPFITIKPCVDLSWVGFLLFASYLGLRAFGYLPIKHDLA